MELFQLTVGEGPLVAAAIHSGHAIRPAVVEHLALDEAERLREEDPFTEELAALAPTHIIGRRSRFEVDLNRPPEKAVYLEPADAWGLTVWRGRLPDALVAESLAHYDMFYATVRALLEQLLTQHKRIVVLDVHSYNHRRNGAASPIDDEAANPEVNIGTGSMDGAVWGGVVDRLIADLRACKAAGRPLDVRENVRFRGGHFPQWIHATFPEQVCAIAIEFKKTFMDEWTGEVYPPRFEALKGALLSTFPGLRAALDELRAPARHDLIL